MRVWLMSLGALAGLYGAAGVALAAAGAHLAHDQTVTTAAMFLLLHAAALVGLCGISASRPDVGVLAGASTIALGTLLFSGDLALRGLAGVVLVHLAAPTGGVAMIVGWLIVAVALPVALGRGGDARKPH